MFNITEENCIIMEHCANSNDPAYNTNKALEECVEFQEVLLKLQTKHPNNPNRPNEQEALKEFGDVIYRGFIALSNLFPEHSLRDIQDGVARHITKKLSKLEKYRLEGSYKGGL